MAHPLADRDCVLNRILSIPAHPSTRAAPKPRRLKPSWNLFLLGHTIIDKTDLSGYRRTMRYIAIPANGGPIPTAWSSVNIAGLNPSEYIVNSTTPADQNTVAVITSEVPQGRRSVDSVAVTTTVRLHLVQMPTGNPHPGASQPAIPVVTWKMQSRGSRRPRAPEVPPEEDESYDMMRTHVACFHNFVALLIYSDFGTTEDLFFVFEWTTGRRLSYMTAPPGSYESFTILGAGSIVLANKLQQKIEVWRIAANGKLLLQASLAIPHVASMHTIIVFRVNCEPRGAPNPMVGFTLIITTPTRMGEDDAAFNFFVRANYLHELASNRRPVKFSSWGPNNSAWFDSTYDVDQCVSYNNTYIALSQRDASSFAYGELFLRDFRDLGVWAVELSDEEVERRGLYPPPHIEIFSGPRLFQAVARMQRRTRNVAVFAGNPVTTVPYSECMLLEASQYDAVAMSNGGLVLGVMIDEATRKVKTVDLLQIRPRAPPPHGAPNQ